MEERRQIMTNPSDPLACYLSHIARANHYYYQYIFNHPNPQTTDNHDNK